MNQPSSTSVVDAPPAGSLPVGKPLPIAPPAADRLSNTPTEGRSADSPQYSVRSADSAQSAEEARRKEWERASRVAIRHRLPLEVLSPLSEAVRTAPAFNETLVKELDERFCLRRNYHISPSGLRAFLFRIRQPRGSVTRTKLAGIRRRQDSVATILEETFGEKGKKNPLLWEKQAFLSLVGLVFERLSTNEKEVSTEELVTLSKMLAEQRRAEAQSRDSAEPQTGPVAVGAGGELPSDFGEAVKQIYGTNFHAPRENVE